MIIKRLVLLATLVATPFTINAAIIDFGIEAPTSGTMSYAGGLNPLIGTGIDVDSIVGLDTPLNTDVPILCDNCVLEFVTGNNTGGWNFEGGGTISITGGVAAANIANGSTLMEGSFESATIIDIGGGFFNFKIAGASFTDLKHENLLAYFGLPLGLYHGGLNISFNTIGSPSFGSAFTSSTLFSGDVTNEPTVVPIPPALLLFGAGLIGIAGISRKK